MHRYGLRVKLLVLWIVFAGLLVAVTNAIGFRTALDAQFQQLRQTLTAIAATGALQIDGDLHATIPPQPSSTQLPAYQQLVTRLRAIRNANPTIRYVYTMAPSDTPGQWHYVGDAEEDQTSLPGDVCDVTRYPAMAAGLQGPSADPLITVDEWGPLLSGYAPIRALDGRAVGVLGIDMSGQTVVRTQEAVRRWRLAVLGLSLMMVGVLGFVIAHWISRPLQTLVRATQRIGQGDLAFRVPVSSRDEVGTLAQAFNRMAELLSDSLRNLQEHVLSTIQSLSLALEAKDRYTRGHSARVQHYAVKIAQELRRPAEEVDLIQRFSPMHDVGKIGVREDVLLKPTKLTPEEFENIKRHPEVGYKILVPLKPPPEALDIVRYHHERLDGQGYPAGLTEPRIPLVVAIVSVADAFDAMTGYRPYRQSPMSFDEAVKELRRCVGTQFRADVVEALVEVLRREGKLKG